VPGKTVLQINEQEQAFLLESLRQARRDCLLGMHIVLLLGRGCNPTEISRYLVCSRTTIYRTIDAYNRGELFWQVEEDKSQKRPCWVRRLLVLVKRAPRAYGWMRTRWSCAALSLTLMTKLGIALSRETVRKELHRAQYVWKRAKLKTRDDDPEREYKLSRIRYVWERLAANEDLIFADELDIDLLAKVGAQWTPKGTQVEIPTPGKNQKRYLAGAVSAKSNDRLSVTGERKNNVLFRALLDKIDKDYPPEITKIYVVLDNFRIHKAKAVEQWLNDHPRFELLWLPRYCPKANPIERIFWDVHERCTRNHTRKRIEHLVEDVEQYLPESAGWNGYLPSIYYESEVTEMVNRISNSPSFYHAA
jgi:putative transposase